MDGDISNFRISGQFFRTNHEIDMNLVQVTKLDKRNTTTSKKIDDDVMCKNYDVIIFFPIYA